ncbi:MAG: DNA primase [Flavobacteriales bacterium]|nr:DNA primase [Flavobacteriales bacterium]
MKISQKTIDEIFGAAIIEEVISDFVDLKKRGANYKGLSPFNEEKTPSFVVSPSKEIWKDFSSGKGGNLISFLMEHEQFSYPESLLYLAKKYNITVEYIDINPDEKKKDNHRESTLIVMNYVKQIFADDLFGSNSKALDYLNNRGINNEIVKLFELGFCPKKQLKLVDQIKSAGYNEKYLHDTRIVNKNGTNRFLDRLIFPIHSISGQVVGFGARVLSDVLKSPKYLNSDTSEIYQKSKVLYGLNFSKKYIKKEDVCYLVEGYTDVIAMFQANIKNVVATCGTALTKEQVRLVKRFTNNIVIIFDSDSAGVSASLKAIDLFLEQDINPEVIQLPTGEDPASFCGQKSTETIKQFFLEHKTNFIEFKCSLNVSDASSDLIKHVKNIIYSISLIHDNIMQAIYIKKAAKKFSLQEEDIRKELNRLAKKTPLTSSRNLNDNTNKQIDFKKLKKNNLEEFRLIRLFINYGSSNIVLPDGTFQTISRFIINELDSDNIGFTTPIFDTLYQEIKKNITIIESQNNDFFLSHSNLIIVELASYIIADQPFLGNWSRKDIVVREEKDLLSQVAKESILRFKLKRVQSMRKNALEKLKNPNASVDNDLTTFTQLNQLEKKIQKELGRIC